MPEIREKVDVCVVGADMQDVKLLWHVQDWVWRLLFLLSVWTV